MKLRLIITLSGLVALNPAASAAPNTETAPEEIEVLRSEVAALFEQAAAEARTAREGAVEESTFSTAARIVRIEKLHAKQRELRELRHTTEAASRAAELTVLKKRLAAASDTEKRTILEQQRAMEHALPKR